MNKIGSLTRLIRTLAKCVTVHTYIYPVKGSEGIDAFRFAFYTQETVEIRLGGCKHLFGGRRPDSGVEIRLWPSLQKFMVKTYV